MKNILQQARESQGYVNGELNPDLFEPGPETELYERYLAVFHQAERAKLYRQAEQMIHDDVARVFVANNEPPLGFSKKVKGYVTNPTGSEHFNTVEVQ